MKNTNGNLPAMPYPEKLLQDSEGLYTIHQTGLTKREELAARFMAAWIVHHGASGDYGYSSSAAALSAIQNADALLAELERTT
jgi:hypothetical protein